LIGSQLLIGNPGYTKYKGRWVKDRLKGIGGKVKKEGFAHWKIF